MKRALDLEKRIGGEDWETVLSFLPKGWEQRSKEFGALRRVRNFNDSKSLLRTLLIHFVDGCSLRETVVRARLGKIAEVSDVALLKRLKASGEWLRWMSVELKNRFMERKPRILFPEGYRFRIVDGTGVQEPGSTGSSWRVHYSIELKSLRCDEMKVTDEKEGETFKRFEVKAGDVMMGDRGYAHPGGVGYVVKKGGHVLVRMNLSNLPVYEEQGKRFELLKQLKRLRGTKIGDWLCYVRDGEHQIPGRICAIRKSRAAAEKARQKILRESKGHRVKPETLEAADYIFVFTTLLSIPALAVLEMYRGRWQIELVFKRLKSIIGLGCLPKQDPEGAKAWIHGKLLAAFLIETLLTAGMLFFPWGYPISKQENETPLLVA